MNYSISPIGFIRSPFKEKFAVPRQPSLTPSVRATLALTGAANHPDSVRDIEQFSHLWLLFLFDKNLEQGWSTTVRPPRLGGNARVGVFASRATFRPNGIGMSAVPLLQVRTDDGQVLLDIGSCDLVDGTPIIDIKPYIPYSDAIEDAVGGFAATKPECLEVIFSDAALASLDTQADGAHKRQVIAEVLAQDPRPAYKKRQHDDKEYAVHLFDFNVTFRVTDKQVQVTAVQLK